MNALDEHGRIIPDDLTGTASSRFERTHQPYCAHGWVVYQAMIDGIEHKFCALCGTELGLANYAATNSASRPRW